jgi:ketosteroid isomerase-like protein
MGFLARDALRVHACCLTGRDVDTVAANAAPDAICFCDGEYVGEGADGIRKALLQELADNEELVARVASLDGETVVAELAGPDGHWSPRAAVRIRADDEGIHEIRITHDPRVVTRLSIENDQLTV